MSGRFRWHKKGLREPRMPDLGGSLGALENLKGPQGRLYKASERLGIVVEELGGLRAFWRA